MHELLVLLSESKIGVATAGVYSNHRSCSRFFSPTTLMNVSWRTVGYPEERASQWLTLIPITLIDLIVGLT